MTLAPFPRALPFLRAILLATASTFVAACEPAAQGLAERDDHVPVFVRSAIVPAAARPTSLRVMAWNVKYGAARIDFWFDYWGDRVQMTRQEVVGNMNQLYALVREVDPDVFMTEEIEVDSRRSAYYDMVTGFLEHTSLNYAAYYPTWDARYVPSEGLGRINLGNAIFSKYPIVEANRIPQEDRTDQSGLTRAFYIHRAIGRAVLDTGERKVAAYVVHTEAYDQDGTKQRQLAQIHDVVGAETLPFVLGGDFNELPPTAAKLVDFPDEHPKAKGTDYEQPPYTPEKMQPFYDDLEPAIPLADYGTTEAEQARFYSHSVLGPDTSNAEGQRGFWNRTLDYLFAKKGGAWVAGSSDVLQSPGRQGIRSDPMRLSDHAPVVGTWVVGP
ncbi:MAG: endonuclease/exonuclease/phosphatase family protein [Polyangiaceae bacterium]